ncbi:MAG: hypothetical protein HC803_02635 [Saprospiraceae bacterium]|nr:hypothetical protein [Saprospiraceae bacterium]
MGGNGRGGTDPTKYVYVEDPTITAGNSMCQQGVTGADLRTLQSSGPFRLDPGAVNELIIGVTWVPNIIDYPCPSFDKLVTADNLAQALFDNCFKITDGPDAPDMDIIEMDNELVIILSNDTLSSNNAYLGYKEVDLQAPIGTVDSVYRFEGYKIYQMAGPTASELDNPEEARLVYQVDRNNGVGKIFNWEGYEDGDAAPVPVFIPNLKVEGGDDGLKHTFQVKEDQFAQSDRALVNHKKYYFLAIAYAYNNYEDYNPITNVGQRNAYLQGRRNIGSDGLGTPYVGIPRIIAPEYAGIKLNATYGDGPSITRLDGSGSGNQFEILSAETEAKILQNNVEDVLVYENGAGPVSVKIVDPLRIKGGKYTLTLVDENLNNSQFDNNVRWMLTDENGESWFSDVNLDVINEQVILDRGISISVGQVPAPGVELVAPNGFVGASATYSENNDESWYSAIPSAPITGIVAFYNADVANYILSGTDLSDDKDPEDVYSTILGGSWVPYTLCNWRVTNPSGTLYDPYLTPAWLNSFGNLIQTGNPLSNLNNVDIIFTSDKSKWTRCPVVETASNYQSLPTENSQGHMKIRTAPSIGKDGQGDNDGTGMSWFPGYAIDVETGERLNVFFGENSIYNTTNFAGIPSVQNGADMIWNPSAVTFRDLDGTGGPNDLSEIVMGGQHFIYVTNTRYDEGASLRSRLGGSNPQIVSALRTVQWTSFPILATGTSLNSMADGLIPNDYRVQLRVNAPYAVSDLADGRVHPNNGYPQYEFNMDEFKPETQSTAVATEALDLINVVPNPYYAYSAYETRRFDNIVKITNVPAKCTITIYSLDGKFIRQYIRDENPGVNSGALTEQAVTSVEWDLKNSKSIPVSAGVYLIHIDVPGVGERVIKWFGVNRTFDSQDL